MNVSVIIPAAGASTRMGGDTRKPFMELCGEPILFRTCRRLKSFEGVTEIILAVHPEDLDYVQGELWDELSARGVNMVVAGGENRQDSVWRAFSACDPSADLVAIHDAVRPFITKEVAQMLFKTAMQRGAAVPIVPLSDTIKRTEADHVVETVPRRGLNRVQTPQVFERELFLDACEYVLSTGGFSENITDDASIVEAYGKEVAVVLGDETNFKITTPRDLRIAEALVRAEGQSPVSS